MKEETAGKRRKMPEYRAWNGMKTRCYNPRCPVYRRYGGRGIAVCERWRNSFTDFLADMGTKPHGKYSLDRINNDGNYEPANCRWANTLEQSRNRSSVKKFLYNGEFKTIPEWCEKFDAKLKRAQNRIRNGASIEDALKEKPQHKGLNACTSVRRISPDGSVKIYRSQTEAAAENNMKCRSAIANCLINKSKTAGGYKWERNQ